MPPVGGGLGTNRHLCPRQQFRRALGGRRASCWTATPLPRRWRRVQAMHQTGRAPLERLLFSPPECLAKSVLRQAFSGGFVGQGGGSFLNSPRSAGLFFLSLIV